MANIKISNLTPAAAVLGTQEFEVNDSLTSKKVTAAQILSYINANSGAVTLTTAQTITGVKTFSQPIVGSITGNAATATSATSATSAGSVTGTTTAAVPTSALGSGTANSTTFLRGDRTWQSPSGPPTLEIVDTQIFTASGTWTKPSGFDSTDTVVAVVIGGGGGGGVGRTGSAGWYVAGGGGGGGGVAIAGIAYGDAPSSVSVTVGSGGISRSQTVNNGSGGGFPGGHSLFGFYALGVGGRGGLAEARQSLELFNARGNAGGFGALALNSTDPTEFLSFKTDDEYRSDAVIATGGPGRGYATQTNVLGIDPGLTGGGGSAAIQNNTTQRAQNATGATGRLFGNGGNGSTSSNASAGEIPGGGGGGCARTGGINAVSGAGARGEVRVFVVRGAVHPSTIHRLGLGV